MDWLKAIILGLLTTGGIYYIKDFIDCNRGTGRYSEENMKNEKDKKDEE
jgi:hypothetical protein